MICIYCVVFVCLISKRFILLRFAAGLQLFLISLLIERRFWTIFFTFVMVFQFVYIKSSKSLSNFLLKTSYFAKHGSQKHIKIIIKTNYSKGSFPRIRMRPLLLSLNILKRSHYSPNFSRFIKRPIRLPRQVHDNYPDGKLHPKTLHCKLILGTKISLTLCRSQGSPCSWSRLSGFDNWTGREVTV